MRRPRALTRAGGGAGAVVGVTMFSGAAPETFGAKILSVFPGNGALGLQSHQGFVALFEPATGAAVWSIRPQPRLG